MTEVPHPLLECNPHMSAARGLLQAGGRGSLRKGGQWGGGGGWGRGVVGLVGEKRGRGGLDEDQSMRADLGRVE